MLDPLPRCSLQESRGGWYIHVTPDITSIQSLLETAGIEIYQSHAAELEIAERVRLHMMDSGVRVKVDVGLTVRFSARSQRSDFPSSTVEALFQRVHEAVGIPASARGFSEAERRIVEIKNPVDDSKILDVWHELVFEKKCDAGELVDEVKWVLDLEKYVDG